MRLPIEWMPPGAAPPEQLIVLLHGWRGEGNDFHDFAARLHAAFPRAALLAPDAPHEGDPKEGDGAPSIGRQWYSLVGLDADTPEGRADWHARVTTAVATLVPWLRAQQRRLGVGPAATALGGFSQGAIVALELALRYDGLAGRVLAFGGCFTAEPATAPRQTTLHLLHGGADRVIPADGSRRALARIGALRGDATLDIAQGVGHELHPSLIDCALERLNSHIPLRTWQAALGAAPRD